MRYRSKPIFIEAMQFKTNNEVGSPNMDSIVNWINQDRMTAGAWHNGTDIFILDEDYDLTAQVNDYIVKQDGRYCIFSKETFEKEYELVD